MSIGSNCDVLSSFRRFVLTPYSSTDLTISVRAALADPLGANAVQQITQYWTAFERNGRLILLAGILLLNRVLWLGLGAVVLAITFAKFNFSYPEQGQKKRKQIVTEDDVLTGTPRALPIAHPLFSAGASLRQFFFLTQIQFTETVRNVFFGVLLLAGGLFAIFSASGINNPLATPTYPVTAKMLEDGGRGFFIFALAIIIFYAGELAWRERDAQLNQIVDALPMQRWVLFTSKLTALMLIQVMLVLVIWTAGLIVQITRGYYQFELGVYFKELFGMPSPPARRRSVTQDDPCRHAHQHCHAQDHKHQFHECRKQNRRPGPVLRQISFTSRF